MRDPHEFDRTSARPPATKAPETPTVGNAALWTMAALLAATNMALSFAGLNIVSSVFGALALICLVILGVRHSRRRRS